MKTLVTYVKNGQICQTTLKGSVSVDFEAGTNWIGEIDEYGYMSKGQLHMADHGNCIYIETLSSINGNWEPTSDTQFESRIRRA